jgi:hypothetical protein
MYKKRVLVVVCLIISLLFSSSSAYASTSQYLTGYTWTNRQLDVYISTSGYYSGVPASKYQAWKSLISQSVVMLDYYLDNNNINLDLSLTDDINAAEIIFIYAPVTGTWAQSFRTTSGTTITTAMVALDDYDFITIGFNDIYLNRIFMHELGHTIGLADIDPAYAESNGIYSFMVNDIFSSNFSWNPTSFDINNIKLMY